MATRNTRNGRANTTSPAYPRANGQQADAFPLNNKIADAAATFARDNKFDAQAALAKHQAESLAEQEKRRRTQGTGVTRVFGAEGAVVQLGGTLYHLAIFTTRGILDFQDYMTSAAVPAVDGETAGEQFVGAALMSRNFSPIRDLLGWILAESGPNRTDLPETICEDASPGQLRDAIDTFIQQNGLTWLEMLVKTYGGQAMLMIKQQMDLAMEGALRQITFDPPTTGTVKNFPGWTQSSSTLPDLQPTPEQE